MIGLKSSKNGAGTKGKIIGNRVYGFGTAFRVAPGPCEVFKTYKDEDKANVLFPDYKTHKGGDYVFAGNSALGGAYGIWIEKFDMCT